MLKKLSLKHKIIIAVLGVIGLFLVYLHLYGRMLIAKRLGKEDAAAHNITDENTIKLTIERYYDDPLPNEPLYLGDVIGKVGDKRGTKHMNLLKLIPLFFKKKYKE